MSHGDTENYTFLNVAWFLPLVLNFPVIGFVFIVLYNDNTFIQNNMLILYYCTLTSHLYSMCS